MLDLAPNKSDLEPAISSREAISIAARIGRIKSVIGVTAGVRVVDPGAVERSQGKVKRVVDLRPKG